MSSLHVCNNKLDNSLRFRLSKIKLIEDFFIAGINNREKMSKTLNYYITAIDYADRTLLVFSGKSSCASIYSFTIANGTPAGIASASISLLFLISNEIVKYL